MLMTKCRIKVISVDMAGLSKISKCLGHQGKGAPEKFSKAEFTMVHGPYGAILQIVQLNQDPQKGTTTLS